MRAVGIDGEKEVNSSIIYEAKFLRCPDKVAGTVEGKHRGQPAMTLTTSLEDWVGSGPAPAAERRERPSLWWR